MKLEVGTYVRTKYGQILKVINIRECEVEGNEYYFDEILNRNGEKEYDDNVLYEGELNKIPKSSFDIIDLVQVGDYVNDLKITLINEPSLGNDYKRVLYAEDRSGYLIESFDNDDIKSIVTREQFEAMSYKVGE